MNKILFMIFSFISLLSHTRQRNVSVHSLDYFLKKYPSTKVIQCTSNYQFNYEPFPLREIYGRHLWHPQGIFRNIFALEIPKGLICLNSEKTKNFLNIYFLFINNIHLDENFRPQVLSFHDSGTTEYIKGRVAVISHIGNLEYGHFMLDILSNLALLEICNIEYDYLLIPQDYEYMKEALDLWGIDRSKIIALKSNHAIQADTLIYMTVPGLLADKMPAGCGGYYIDRLIAHIRKKLLLGVEKLNLSMPISSKIFISKKDTVMGGRNIKNEDEVFAEFEKLGYQRYEFVKMSLAEKIYRANNATHIITVVGSGGLHAMFMKPGGYFFEIQNIYPESTFCYLVQNVQMNYRCFNCTTRSDLLHNNWLTPGKDISIDLIKNLIADNPDL